MDKKKHSRVIAQQALLTDRRFPALCSSDVSQPVFSEQVFLSVSGKFYLFSPWSRVYLRIIYIWRYVDYKHLRVKYPRGVFIHSISVVMGEIAGWIYFYTGGFTQRQPKQGYKKNLQMCVRGLIRESI